MVAIMADGKKLLPTIVVAITATAVFLLDLGTPLGTAAAAFYPAVVLLSLWLPRQRDTYITAVACTMLALLGSFFLPGVLVNRLAGIIVVWSMALFSRLVRQRTERLRAQATLLDQVPDAVLVCDLDNRVRLWNRGAEKLYGWAAEEVLGRNVNACLFQ